VGNQLVRVVKGDHELAQLLVAMLDEAGNEVHMGGMEKVPELKWIHVPVECAGVIDEVKEAPERSAVHILDLH